MLPSVHPPAATTIALNLILSFFIKSMTKQFFWKGPSFRKLGCIRVCGVQGIEADIEDVIFWLEGD